MAFKPQSGKTSAKMAPGHVMKRNGPPTKFVREVVMPTKLKVAPKFRGTLKKGQRVA